jgi:hypothetical protein
MWGRPRCNHISVCPMLMVCAYSGLLAYSKEAQFSDYLIVLYHRSSRNEKRKLVPHVLHEFSLGRFCAGQGTGLVRRFAKRNTQYSALEWTEPEYRSLEARQRLRAAIICR